MQEEFGRTGQVFTVGVLHKKMTFLLGPEVSAHFFKAKDDELSRCVPAVSMSEQRGARPLVCRRKAGAASGER